MNRGPSGAAVLVPVAGLVASMGSIQVGAALAQRLFPLVGPQGTTALRVALAAAILLVLRRPSLRLFAGPHGRTILAYGAALGVMNLLFYLALRTIPLGVAVAVEFTGPLALAVLSHRARADALWLVLAVVGLVILAPFGRASTLDPAGLLYALGAGACWALYILFGQKAGETDPGAATALGMMVAAVVVIPFGLARAGTALFDPALLPVAAAVAVLSSALPYTLEMFALTRLPRATIGILMSLEPALGVLAGWIILGQHLTLRQGVAITCVILASAGAALTLVRSRTGPVQLP